MNKKITYFIIVPVFLFLFCLPAYSVAKKTSNIHTIEYISKDNYVISSTLKYPQKQAKKYPFVILIHSWAQSSKYWGKLPNALLNKGYAVLEVDLRGHGKSNRLANMKQFSYMYLSSKSVLQMPNDIYQTLSQVYNSYSNLSRTEVYFIGADIGASVALKVAEFLGKAPAAMVLISPQVDFKGISVTDALVEIGDVPILSVASVKDTHSISEINTLKKYSQSSFSILKLPVGGPGMLCVTTNEGAISTVVTWLVQKTPSLKHK